MTNFVNRRVMLKGAAGGLLAAPAMIGPAIAAGEFSWRLQSHWPKSSVSFTASLDPFMEAIRDRTDGRLQIEVYGAGEFAQGKEIFNIVRKGVVQMGTNSPSYWLDNAETATFVMGIPGTFREPWEHMHYLKNEGIEAILHEELAGQGVYFRAEKVYVTEMVCSKIITSIDNFRSLKIRSTGTMLEYLASTGAAAQMINGSELYQALSTGVVDGAHWGAALGAQSMSLWEVAKYHYKPPLGLNCDAWIVNMDAMELLPDDLRMILTTTMDELFSRRTIEFQLNEQLALQEGIRDNGVEVVQMPQDVLDTFAQASLVILEKEAGRGPKAQKAAETLKVMMEKLGYL